VGHAGIAGIPTAPVEFDMRSVGLYPRYRRRGGDGILHCSSKISHFTERMGRRWDGVIRNDPKGRREISVWPGAARSGCRRGLRRFGRWLRGAPPLTTDGPDIPAAYPCASPWMCTRPNTSRSTGRRSIAYSILRPTGVSTEPLPGGAGTIPSFSSAAAGCSSKPVLTAGEAEPHPTEGWKNHARLVRMLRASV
jgi:hypothetical protein